MDDEIRARREEHLLLIRLGTRYSQRVERLANKYGVTESAIKMDESRMDRWLSEVANTASFEKKAGFLLHQLRSQAEGLEQLASTASNSRQDAVERRRGLKETFEEYQELSPQELGIPPEEYYSLIARLGKEMNQADYDAKDWAKEERLNRREISGLVIDEFEARQSLGEIEERPDRIEIDMEKRVEERKVFAGLDLSSFPGISEARLVGADLGSDEEELPEGVSVEVEDRSDV